MGPPPAQQQKSSAPQFDDAAALGSLSQASWKAAITESPREQDKQLFFLIQSHDI